MEDTHPFKRTIIEKMTNSSSEFLLLEFTAEGFLRCSGSEIQNTDIYHRIVDMLAREWHNIMQDRPNRFPILDNLNLVDKGRIYEIPEMTAGQLAPILCKMYSTVYKKIYDKSRMSYIATERPFWWPVGLPYTYFVRDNRVKRERDPASFLCLLRELLLNLYNFHGDKLEAFFQQRLTNCSESLQEAAEEDGNYSDNDTLSFFSSTDNSMSSSYRSLSDSAASKIIDIFKTANDNHPMMSSILGLFRTPSPITRNISLRTIVTILMHLLIVWLAWYIIPV